MQVYYITDASSSECITKVRSNNPAFTFIIYEGIFPQDITSHKFDQISVKDFLQLK